jgi:hypothetical protein
MTLFLFILIALVVAGAVQPRGIVPARKKRSSWWRWWAWADVMRNHRS